jgi:integrase/recombinase XerC/integrase/recombinase XerD
MRKSELFNLQWPDVDFENREINIQPKDDWHTKNYKPRKAFMTPALYETLIQHRSLCEKQGIKSDYVFTYRGKRLRQGIDRTLAKAVEKAGLHKNGKPNVTLHTLRHTQASQLAIAGVPLRYIQELMGHQSFETTLQYAHLSEEPIRKQVLRLPFSELGHKTVTNPEK